MERPVRIMLAALGTFFFALVAVWLLMNLSIGWINSMSLDDPLRRFWDPYLKTGVSHCIEVFFVLWLFLFGLYWLFSGRLRDAGK